MSICHAFIALETGLFLSNQFEIAYSFEIKFSTIITFCGILSHSVLLYTFWLWFHGFQDTIQKFFVDNNCRFQSCRYHHYISHVISAAVFVYLELFLKCLLILKRSKIKITLTIRFLELGLLRFFGRFICFRFFTIHTICLLISLPSPKFFFIFALFHF